MNKVEIRPRFNLSVPYSKKEIIGKLRAEVQNPDSACKGNFVKPVAVLSVRDENSHFWSPELGLEFVEGEDETQIMCVLGPSSVVWTMFAAFYGFAILVGVAGLVLGLSQWYLKMSAWGFLLMPASIILLAAAYGIALTGQKLAYDQMVILRRCLDNALGTEGFIPKYINLD